MYYQSIENAFELAKVADKSDVALQKASVYAAIAQAIAANLSINLEDQKESSILETMYGEQPMASVPVQNVEENVTVTADNNTNEVVAEEPISTIPVPPEHMKDETPEARELRYKYLIKKYGNLKMVEIPEDVYPYLQPEGNVLKVLNWLWNDEHHDNAEARIKRIVMDLTEKTCETLADITLQTYLEKFIPCANDWIFFLMFENPSEVNEYLAACTRNRYTDFKTLETSTVGVWHTAVEKYMEHNFKDVEKAS